MAQKANSLAHTKWMCKYHIVFTPKYRRKVIYNQLRNDIGEILRTLCRYQGVEIIEGHLMSDHVHMLSAKEECFGFYRISEGKKRTDDIRQTCKPEIQIWKPTFLSRRILCQHCWPE